MRGEATVVLCGLPVDGLKTILKPGGRTEFPLADNSPNDSTPSNGCGEYDQNRHGCAREAG